MLLEHNYKADLGSWLSGDELGESSGYLVNTNRSSTLPKSGWKFDDGTKWQTDPQLRVVPVNDTSHLICPVITITATGESERKQSGTVPIDRTIQCRTTCLCK